jgi:hypothetical protein
MFLEHCGDVALSSLAIAAPAGSEFEDEGLTKSVDFLTRRFVHCAILGEKPRLVLLAIVTGFSYVQIL